jgi:hypothetical protein
MTVWHWIGAWALCALSIALGFRAGVVVGENNATSRPNDGTLGALN